MQSDFQIHCGDQTKSRVELAPKKKKEKKRIILLRFFFFFLFHLQSLLLLLLTEGREGADWAGVPAALPAGLPAAALTHTGPRDATAPS